MEIFENYIKGDQLWFAKDIFQNGNINSSGVSRCTDF